MDLCCTALHNLKQATFLDLSQPQFKVLSNMHNEENIQEKKNPVTPFYSNSSINWSVKQQTYWNKSRHRKQLFGMNRWPQVRPKPNSNRHLLCSYMETHAGRDPGWWIYIHLSPAHLCKGQKIEFLHLLLAEPIAHSSASQESLHFSGWWPDVTAVSLQWKQETVFLYNPVKPKPREIISAWNDEHFFCLSVKSKTANDLQWTIKRHKCV